MFFSDWKFMDSNLIRGIGVGYKFWDQCRIPSTDPRLTMIFFPFLLTCSQGCQYFFFLLGKSLDIQWLYEFSCRLLSFLFVFNGEKRNPIWILLAFFPNEKKIYALSWHKTFVSQRSFANCHCSASLPCCGLLDIYFHKNMHVYVDACCY